MTTLTTRFVLRRIARAFETGRILPYLFLTMTSLVFAFATVMWIVDRKDFPTFGRALWWSVVTVTTTGYGDVVPQEPYGKAVASVLMVGGYVFLALVTGTVASALVTRHAETAGRDALQASLEQIESRLTTLEQAGKAPN